MPHLAISLLGPFHVMLHGETLTTFATDKTRALLAYLAVEADRPQRRQSLAGLFWPNSTESTARTNLRQALHRLHRTIESNQAPIPHLLLNGQEIQFNAAGNSWLDVREFDHLIAAYKGHHRQGRTLCAECRQRLQRAVTLYRGDFLAGFSLPDSAAFDAWQLAKQEAYHRQALEILYRLGDHYEACADYVQAAVCARRAIELEPWRESAHRRLMRALAFNGQQVEALQQFEICRRILEQELRMAPSSHTQALCAQIRDGKLDRRRISSPAPVGQIASPASAGSVHPAPPAPFAGFEGELATLHRHLEGVLADQGRLVFVCGEAGSGKSMLLAEFARQAAQAHGDLLVAAGRCSSRYGFGEPCEPFREILCALAADMENGMDSGLLDDRHRQRLWAAFPTALAALLEVAPDLVGSWVPAEPLARRAQLVSGLDPRWRQRLQAPVGRQAAGIVGAPGSEPVAGARPARDIPGDFAQPAVTEAVLFEQLSRVLRSLGGRQPLLLILDDLQWAGPVTCSLLFHLARHLAGSRLLVLGAYRPENLTLGQERHPLQPVLRELQGDYGDIQIDLSQADHRAYLEAYLDGEPNRLDAAFRETLYRRTEGHPLFTVELLRNLQARGELARDEDGRWVAGDGLDWEVLPSRVEAVIGERIERVPAAGRQLLAAASVQGDVFTAEAVAAALGEDELEVTRRLSDELGRQHQLVQAHSLRQMGSRNLARYRFRHHLFQQHLYLNLDAAPRAQLHRATGKVLQAWRNAQPDLPPMRETRAARLAWHFEQAGMAAEAIPYLLEAGKEAYLLSANEPAIGHLTRGLDLLQQLPQTRERDRQELLLQLALSAPLRAVHGYATVQLRSSYARACALAQQLDDLPLLFSALFLLYTYHYFRGEYRQAVDVARRMADLADKTQQPAHLAQSNFISGVMALLLGKPACARRHLDAARTVRQSHSDNLLISPLAQNIGIAASVFAPLVLWLQGYPDQALQQYEQTLEQARQLDHAYTLTFAQAIAGCVICLRREYGQLQEQAGALLQIAREGQFHTYQAWAKIFLGRAQIEGGWADEGLALLRQGLCAYQSSGQRMSATLHLALLAEGYGRVGDTDRALEVLAEAVNLAQEGERFFEAELYRIRGDLLLAMGDEAQAQASLHRAVQIAGEQGARSLELRATLSLARLWLRQGRAAEARQMLAEIYNWFTEGFDTPDLQEARAVLDELSKAATPSTSKKTKRPVPTA